MTKLTKNKKVKKRKKIVMGPKKMSKKAPAVKQLPLIDGDEDEEPR